MGASLLALAACALPAQTTPPPAFEVASIKPSAPPPNDRMTVRMRYDAGRVNYGNVSLKDVLSTAYRVRRNQISAPDWMDDERFDIVATKPADVPSALMPEMLQSLLAERFQMKVHRENRERPVYVLVVAKDGAKLKPSEHLGRPATGLDGAPMAVRGSVSLSQGHIQFRGATLALVADFLSNALGRPVTNETALDGEFDIELGVAMEELPGLRRMPPPTLDAAPGGAEAENRPAPETAPAASIFTAIQQLGLKLEARKAPVEFLVVDAAEKIPTGN
jgi:uncharacterized protein (TIGR03435 family)